MTLIALISYSCRKDNIKSPIATYMVNSTTDSFSVELQANSINQTTHVKDNKFLYEVQVKHGSKYKLKAKGEGFLQVRVYLDGTLINTKLIKEIATIEGNF